MFERVQKTNREEWLKERGKGIGGSDAAVAFGISHWKTNVRLWEEKTGLVDPEETNSEATKYGIACEDALRQIFIADYSGCFKVTHNENEILIKADQPYLRASLDGEIEVLNDVDIKSFARSSKYESDVVHLKKGQMGILEIKTYEVTSSLRNIVWTEDIPYDYYIQTLHYLNVTDYDFVMLRVKLRYTIGNMIKHEMRDYIYTKEKHLSDVVYIGEEMTKFWLEYVLKKQKPPLLIKTI